MKPITGFVCGVGILSSLGIALATGVPMGSNVYGSHPFVAVWALVLTFMFICVALEND